MKIKIYLKEWFYNAGIVGFLRILEHSKKEICKIEGNYLEFEAEDIQDFNKCYFKYFFDKYNIAEKMKNKMENSFLKIQNQLEKENSNKQQEKLIQDKIKSEKKYIKAVLKSQLDKIKKVDEEIYSKMLDEYNKIDKVKQKDNIPELQNIQRVLVENFQLDKVNKKLTMNLFKSILGNKYFGQVSFLNVVKTALSFEEQEEVMYKDYLSNIIETSVLENILENKYTTQDLQKYVEDKLKNGILTKEFISVYNNISKYIEKGKSIKDIQTYIKGKVFSNCYMCENEKTITSNYSESNFLPLAISSDNMKNFFWNQNAKFPVCDICKLILFCIPAGITSITKTIKENNEYREKEILSFINYDTDIKTLKQTNENFASISKTDKTYENPYTQLILNIVEQNTTISNWQLQNIFVVEFESEYLAFSRMEYFNIKKYVANFFTIYAKATLNKITEYKYKLQLVDNILKSKDINYVINQRLRDEILKDNSNGFNSFLATRIRLMLNMLKKEGLEVTEEIKKNDNKLKVLYNLGIEIHEQLKRNNEENKLNGFVYKMLNSIKAGNKKEFMDIVIRVHISMGKDVSPIFIETMQEENLDFESIGHSFLAGLISNKYEKKEEV